MWHLQSHRLHSGGYAMLVKIYGAERAGEARYSPAQLYGRVRRSFLGNLITTTFQPVTRNGKTFQCEWE